MGGERLQRPQPAALPPWAPGLACGLTCPCAAGLDALKADMERFQRNKLAAATPAGQVRDRRLAVPPGAGGQGGGVGAAQQRQKKRRGPA
jgi:hypothetical protein